MNYFVTFLEGIITFISPCLLPMLPVYVTYFSAGNKDGDKRTVLKNTLGFVLGFTVTFVSLGALAGVMGNLLTDHKNIVNIVTGTIVIIFGLNFLGVLKIPFLNMSKQSSKDIKVKGVVSAFVFGFIFSIGWTPCVGAFLGSALMLASSQGSVLNGIILLLCYSAGLAIPFILCGLLIDSLTNAFNFIKRNYKVINIVSGSLLVVIGILMITGMMDKMLKMFS